MRKLYDENQPVISIVPAHELGDFICTRHDSYSAQQIDGLYIIYSQYQSRFGVMDEDGSTFLISDIEYKRKSATSTKLLNYLRNGLTPYQALIIMEL